MTRERRRSIGARIAIGTAIALAAGIGSVAGTLTAVSAALRTPTQQGEPVQPPWSPAWPAWEWEAADVHAGTAIRAVHVRDLRNAVEHLLSRELQGTNRPSDCAARLAGYIAGGAGIHQYIENNRIPREEWTRENLMTYQEQLREEDAIRSACLPGYGGTRANRSVD